MEEKTEIKKGSYEERITAQEHDNERKRKMWQAADRLEEKKKEDEREETRHKKFVSEIIKKTNEVQRQNAIDKEYKEEKAKEQKRKANKKSNKEVYGRVSGSSFRDIFKSDEFKNMWKESKEGEER